MAFVEFGSSETVQFTWSSLEKSKSNQNLWSQSICTCFCIQRKTNKKDISILVFNNCLHHPKVLQFLFYFCVLLTNSIGRLLISIVFSTKQSQTKRSTEMHSHIAVCFVSGRNFTMVFYFTMVLHIKFLLTFFVYLYFKLTLSPSPPPPITQKSQWQNDHKPNDSTTCYWYDCKHCQLVPCIETEGNVSLHIV